MSTTNNPVVNVAPTAPAAPKVSLIKHIGNFLSKLGKIFVKDVAPAEPTIALALEALLPQFATVIARGDAIFTKIAKQILVTQTSAALVATPPSGETKLAAVTQAVSAELDQWLQNLFPGSKQIAAAEKAGLVQAVFNIVDKQAPSVNVTVAPGS